MGFHVLAKHGLNKHGLKDPNLVSFGEEKTLERERERREGEKKEEEEDGGAKIKPTRYGTLIFGIETELKYGFMEF